MDITLKNHHTFIDGLNELQIFQKRNRWMKQILVRGLPSGYTEHHLRQLYSTYGQVVRAETRTIEHTSQTYGLVDFAGGENCNLAANGTDRRPSANGRLQVARQFTRSQTRRREHTTVCVEFLPRECGVDRIRRRFEPYGSIVGLRWLDGMYGEEQPDPLWADYDTGVLLTFEFPGQAFAVIRDTNGRPFDIEAGGANLLVELTDKQLLLDSVWHAMEMNRVRTVPFQVN